MRVRCIGATPWRDRGDFGYKQRLLAGTAIAACLAVIPPISSVKADVFDVANGLVANASGVFSATGGDVTINATGSIQGTEAIVASSNFAGNVTVQTSGNVTAQQDPNVFAPQFAIDALTENGTSKVTVDAGTV